MRALVSWPPDEDGNPIHRTRAARIRAHRVPLFELLFMGQPSLVAVLFLFSFSFFVSSLFYFSFSFFVHI
jgi:hypothetical protein